MEGGGSVPSPCPRPHPRSIFCHKCEGLCPKECKVGTKTIDSTRAAQELAGCTLVEGNLIVNIRRGCECRVWPRAVGSLSGSAARLTDVGYPQIIWPQSCRTAWASSRPSRAS